MFIKDRDQWLKEESSSNRNCARAAGIANFFVPKDALGWADRPMPKVISTLAPKIRKPAPDAESVL